VAADDPLDRHRDVDGQHHAGDARHREDAGDRRRAGDGLSPGVDGRIPEGDALYLGADGRFQGDGQRHVGAGRPLDGGQRPGGGEIGRERLPGGDPGIKKVNTVYS
jgi:hypothetical protein